MKLKKSGIDVKCFVIQESYKFIEFLFLNFCNGERRMLELIKCLEF